MPIRLTEPEIAEIQKQYGYLVNYQTEDSTTPINPLTYVDSNGDHLLHIAAQRGDLRTVELLIKAGVNVNEAGDMGSTALHYARHKNRDDVVSFLLANGALPTIKNEFGRFPGEA